MVGCERLEVNDSYANVCWLECGGGDGARRVGCGGGVGQELRDPANLAGERVRPSVMEREIPANEGATGAVSRAW